MDDRGQIDKLRAFPHSAYESVDLDHLIVYAAGCLDDAGAELSFENIVAASFRLFPKKFSLIGFPEYPDSNRVNKALWRLSRDRKYLWLAGRVRQGFAITDRSQMFIREAKLMLEGRMPARTKASSQTRRHEALIADVTASPAYRKYTSGEMESISEGDFCFLLQATLDSSRETLRKNFQVLKKFAGELERTDLAEFLAWLEKRFEHLTRDDARRGGE